jgi:hypothetical protein
MAVAKLGAFETSALLTLPLLDAGTDRELDRVVRSLLQVTVITESNVLVVTCMRSSAKLVGLGAVILWQAP